MDNIYKGELLKAAAIVRKLQDRIDGAVKEGKIQTKPWLAVQRKVLLAEATAEMNDTLTIMQKMVTQNYIDRIKAAEVARRGGKREVTRREDSTEKLFQQQRAASMLRGLDPMATIQQFRDIVSVLNEEEKGYRWIYEDVLKSMVRDQDYTLKVEQVIDDFRTPEERDALKEMDKAAMFRDHDTTLRNLLQYEAQNIAEGKVSTKYDWASLHDEMVQNVETQVTTQGEREAAFNSK